MQNLRLITALAAMVMTATSLTACGGNECGSGTTEKDGKCVSTGGGATLECGEGTTLMDGKCVADGVTMCGDGTELVGDECVPTGDTTTCGAGTMKVGDECVPTSELECGAGTVEQSGECVPSNPNITCGAGTVEQSGSCVVAMAACGAGTQLDANSGTCVVTDTVCGAGTAFSNGSCLPTDAVCAAGTTFNEQTGTCLPDATCQVGDVVLNGVCVTPVAKLIAEATVQEAENNDPALGGAAQALTLPAAGTQLVVAGAIGAPTDLDADGAADQDSDAFTVTLAAGDLIQLSVQPLAGPSLGFVVFGPDGTSYTRSSTLGLGQGAARQIFAPVAGEYTVIVEPAVTLAGNGGPVGNADWKYALTAEVLAAPTPTDVDTTANPISGQFVNLSDNLFRVTNLTGGLTQIKVNSVGANAEGVYYVGSSLDTMTRVLPATVGATQTLVLPAGANLVFFDWTEVNGPDTAFEATAAAPTNFQDLGALSNTLTISTPATLPAGDVYYYTFTGTAGQVLQLSQSNAETSSLRISVAEASGAPTVALGAYYDAALGTKVTQPITLSSTGSSAYYSYARLASDGTYIISVTTNATTTTPRTNVKLEAKLLSVTDLGTKNAGEPISLTAASQAAADRTYTKVTFLDDVRISATITQSTGDPDLHIYRADGTLQCFGDTSITNCFAPAGEYYFELNAFSAITNAVVNITTTLTPVAEVEPNNDAATATPIVQGRQGTGSFGNADTDFFAINVPTAIPAGSALRVTLTPSTTTGSSPVYTCTLRDSAGATVATAVSPNDCVLYGGALAAGTYTLELSSSATSTGSYSFITSVITGFGGFEVEPNNDAATATPFTLGSTIFGDSSAGATVDADVYTFTLAAPLAAGQTFLSQFTSLGGRSAASTFVVELRDSANTLVASGVSISNSTLAAGTYTLTVKRSSSSTSTTGRYSLRALVATIPTVEFQNTTTGTVVDNTPAGIDRTIAVTKPNCVIASTTVFVNVTHTYKGDVRIKLTAPDGTVVRLHNNTGGSDDNVIETYPFTAAPTDTLDALNGKDPNGTWTLNVADTVSVAGGTFNSWGLAFTCAP